MFDSIDLLSFSLSPSFSWYFRVNRDVTLSYQSSPDSRALTRVNLSVEPGEHLSICGPSGSGKTSVLAVILR
jgi:ABC-type transport system involved in cytochrome bd biosynthesis fused ATPase/permease subunit